MAPLDERQAELFAARSVLLQEIDLGLGLGRGDFARALGALRTLGDVN